MQGIDQATGMALEMGGRMDLGFQVVDRCWDICFDSRVTHEELVSGQFDHKFVAMNKCGNKCVARYFEAMQLMIEGRIHREREQAGLNG